MDLEQLAKDGLLQKCGPARDLADKEFTEAGYDLEGARDALQAKDNKWAIVKGYYSVFHSAKGALFLAGYRETSHFALGEALRCMADSGKLESRYVSDFKAAMSARQAADYHYDYPSDKAEYVVGLAGEFVARMRKLKKVL